MNRLETLKSTLPANIRESKEFDVEFVLVNYNSTDGTSEWVKKNMGEHLQSGRLKFYNMVKPRPIFFSHSHSRNIAFRLATRRVLCNVNADYFVASSFYRNLPKLMSQPSTAFILGYDGVESDNFGRICIFQQDFLDIGGYDERFVGHGYEDIDLCSRLILSGVKVKKLNKSYWKQFINQPDVDRISNSFEFTNTRSIFVKKFKDGVTDICFLFKDGSSHHGTIRKSNHDIPLMIDGGWNSAKWKPSKTGVHLSFDGKEKFLDRNEYTAVTNRATFQKLILMKSQIANYRMMLDNIKTNSIRVNNSGWGSAIVEENFCKEIKLN